jgi:hypothetical protein
MHDPMAGRKPIPKEELSEEQTRLLEQVCREGPELKAAFNRILEERGIPLQLAEYRLGASDVATERPQEFPPPGGCYCCRDGVCWCC